MSADRHRSVAKSSPETARVLSLVCPTCQSVVTSIPPDHLCPVCESSLKVVSKNLQTQDEIISPSHRSQKMVEGVTSGQASSAGSLGLRSSPFYGAGTIVGDPIRLQNEPRDVDPLQAVVSILLLIEFTILIAAISLPVLIFVIALVAVAVSLGSRDWIVVGCLSNLVRGPLTALGNIMRGLLGGIWPHLSASNYREVREYHLDLIEGGASTFVVKGNTTPRTLRPGDKVRVWITRRHGRPYLRRGFVEQNGAYVPLRISEPPLGVYWLVGFLVFNAILVSIYLTLIGV